MGTAAKLGRNPVSKHQIQLEYGDEQADAPCAAGSLCIAKPDHTPDPPLFTNHKCRVCGTYLHGMCGLPDPEGDDDMRRVCHGYVNSNNRKKSSTDDEVDSSAGDKGQCTQPVLSPRPPPYTDVARQFGDLEGIAERCSMAGVSYHLRRAKLTWMSEAGSKKTKQTCMAGFV